MIRKQAIKKEMDMGKGDTLWREVQENGSLLKDGVDAPRHLSGRLQGEREGARIDV